MTVVRDTRPLNDVVRDLQTAICGTFETEEDKNAPVYHESTNSLEVKGNRHFHAIKENVQIRPSEEEIFAMLLEQRITNK